MGCPRMASFGGVLRDHKGDWLHGFSSFRGDVDILLAELFGMKQGLMLAWDLNYRIVILESDSKEAIQLISTENMSPFHVYGAVLNGITYFLKKPLLVEIVHTLREGNHCTHALAKRGASQRDRLRN